MQLCNENVTLKLRFPKTDQFGKSSVISINRSLESSVCCDLLESFLQFRSQKDGPLFCHINGAPLSAYQFSSVLHKALKFLSIETKTKTFKTHSSRIDAATQLYMSGIHVSEQEIQRKGRWVSDAYKNYIRPELITF